MSLTERIISFSPSENHPEQDWDPPCCSKGERDSWEDEGSRHWRGFAGAAAPGEGHSSLGTLWRWSLPVHSPRGLVSPTQPGEGFVS